MDKTIQFIANYDDWVAIKKLKIEEKTDPKTIMEFLAGLTTSIDFKIEENLKKIIALNKLDEVLKEAGTGKKEEEIAGVLSFLNSRKVSAVIGEITGLPELQKNEQKELEGFCKVYAAKKLLKACNLAVDYSSVEIPGMKRLQKMKA